ncbi:hypothetical protein BaRGS_00013874 [Batillaria attramentaria]|uniref:Uncharacterized protein n=1 Tax=Batillaria attramentaria TaxID=370345 RepID=A0ABD0L784_9CAEN
MRSFGEIEKIGPGEARLTKRTTHTRSSSIETGDRREIITLHIVWASELSPAATFPRNYWRSRRLKSQFDTVRATLESGPATLRLLRLFPTQRSLKGWDYSAERLQEKPREIPKSSQFRWLNPAAAKWLILAPLAAKPQETRPDLGVQKRVRKVCRFEHGRNVGISK